MQHQKHKQLTSRPICSIIVNKDQLLLTNQHNALHHGERAANKSGGRSVW